MASNRTDHKLSDRKAQ